jgi:hypothetical protein
MYTICYMLKIQSVYKNSDMSQRVIIKLHLSNTRGDKRFAKYRAVLQYGKLICCSPRSLYTVATNILTSTWNKFISLMFWFEQFLEIRLANLITEMPLRKRHYVGIVRLACKSNSVSEKEALCWWRPELPNMTNGRIISKALFWILLISSFKYSGQLKLKIWHPYSSTGRIHVE